MLLVFASALAGTRIAQAGGPRRTRQTTRAASVSVLRALVRPHDARLRACACCEKLVHLTGRPVPLLVMLSPLQFPPRSPSRQNAVSRDRHLPPATACVFGQGKKLTPRQSAQVPDLTHTFPPRHHVSFFFGFACIIEMCINPHKSGLSLISEPKPRLTMYIFQRL